LNNQWFSKVAVWMVIAMVLFTVFKQFDGRTTAGAGYMGYSEFLNEVKGQRIKSATIQEGANGTEIVAITTDDRRCAPTPPTLIAVWSATSSPTTSSSTSSRVKRGRCS